MREAVPRLALDRWGGRCVREYVFGSVFMGKNGLTSGGGVVFVCLPLDDRREYARKITTINLRKENIVVYCLKRLLGKI